MKSAPTVTAKEAISTFVTAALASFIAMAILSGVAFVFLREGKPLQRLAAAERACAHYSYLSERKVCMNAWLAAAQSGAVAHR